MAKDKPAVVGTPLLALQDIKLWYSKNPLPATPIDTHFPLSNTTENTWKTVQNASLMKNVAADPISSKSKVPVSGRQGYKSVLGELSEFGKGREMDADQIEHFEDLKNAFNANPSDPVAAKELIDYYGDELGFVRNAALAERSYLSYAIFSNACSIEFAAENSPYLKGLAPYAYPIDSWQKDAVGTSWANPDAEILDDIEGIIDLGDSHSKAYTYIHINKKWFGYVRKNTQIQKYAATLVSNLFDTQKPPTLEAINTMLDEYFDLPVKFVVLDAKTTRENLDGSYTTANAFKDGVAIFTTSEQLGRFQWKKLATVDPTRETYESFFLVGNYREIDPSYSKVYSKAKGFPAVDTYNDNFNLKIDAVDW